MSLKIPKECYNCGIIIKEINQIGFEDLGLALCKKCTREINIKKMDKTEAINRLEKMKKDNKNNTGNWNSGNSNSGNRNSGDSNSGDGNSGDRNLGDRNSGYWNSGYCNSGDSNSGDRNSGNWNSGYGNSGNRNSGNWNSGNWNSGCWNTGYFNIDKPKVRIFGIETEVKNEDINFPDYLYFDLTEWIDFKDMTEEEKNNNRFAEFTKGYLKTYNYKEAFKNSFENAEIEDIEKTLLLPNFNYEIFEEISGITKKDFDRRLNKDNIKIIGGKKYKLVAE